MKGWCSWYLELVQHSALASRARISLKNLLGCLVSRAEQCRNSCCEDDCDKNSPTNDEPKGSVNIPRLCCSFYSSQYQGTHSRGMHRGREALWAPCSDPLFDMILFGRYLHPCACLYFPSNHSLFHGTVSVCQITQQSYSMCVGGGFETL